MTNEQLKCPVCGEGMIGVEEQEPYPYEFTCINPDCAVLGEYRIGTIAQLEKQIQSRIDKAVQEEREREAVIEERYNKILLAVQSKYEGETRWETALRYIREREDKADDIGEELLP